MSPPFVRPPFVSDVGEMLDYFLDHGSATAEEIEAAGVILGRNSYPALVSDLLWEGLLTPEAAAVVVPSAWLHVEFPNRALGDDEWAELFHLAGYTVDGVPAARPTGSMRLWRGALPEHRRGWSWTDDRALACWFANRPHNAGRSQVYVATVELGRLLARITGRNESQYVVDTRGLPVRAD